ncbi:MAG TPA: R3H domain-containing nucleic acid-binding protein [Pyrinomonadaceae bacterium]|nr:R3H domain-containing nucleic acid-binding protein [Pyrinomonadaceae bacterium]
MQEPCVRASTFLESLFAGTGLDIRVALTETPTECLLDLSGPDAELLQAEGGELLQAVQHLMNQAFGRSLPDGQRLICDVEGFRATREAELRAMAKLAAERVRSTGVPFLFGEMNGSERRVIHLTLAECEDLYTESVGDGAARKLRVALKSAK